MLRVCVGTISCSRWLGWGISLSLHWLANEPPSVSYNDDERNTLTPALLLQTPGCCVIILYLLLPSSFPWLSLSVHFYQNALSRFGHSALTFSKWLSEGLASFSMLMSSSLHERTNPKALSEIHSNLKPTLLTSTVFTCFYFINAQFETLFH